MNSQREFEFMGPEKPERKKTPRLGRKTVTISFVLTEPEKAALLRFAKWAMVPPGKAARQFVRGRLIRNPTSRKVWRLPAGWKLDDLDLWVWSHLEKRKTGQWPEPLSFPESRNPYEDRMLWEPRKKCRLSFKCSEDEKAALMRFAKAQNRTGPNAAAFLVQQQLIEYPDAFFFPGFPPEQSLELWVWASLQAEEKGEPPLSYGETLAVSLDGERVLRFDYLTAA